eukprot:jgi/Mesen1/1283/ME000013S00768
MSRDKKFKYERKLLQKAAQGSLKGVAKYLPEESTSTEEEVHNRHKGSGLPESSIDKEHELQDHHRRHRDSTSGSKKRSKQELHSRKTTKRRRASRRKDTASVDINCQDIDGWTPLHHAASRRIEDLLVYLLVRGAKVTVADRKGDLPIHVAARSGHAENVKLLREAGSSMHTRNAAGQTAAGIIQTRLEALHRRLETGARPEPERPDWAEHLADNISDDEGVGFGWRSTQFATNSQDSDPYENDDWRDVIAEEMRRRAAERRATAPSEAAAKAAPKVYGPQNEEERSERQKKAQQVLEEEQARDKAWREGVLQGKIMHQQKRYEDRWAAFALSCNMGILYEDVPFPVEVGKEADLERVILQGIPQPQHRKRVRAEVLRWHPDKFYQKWGQRLADKGKDRLLARVKEISQAIHDVYARINSEAA